MVHMAAIVMGGVPGLKRGLGGSDRVRAPTSRSSLRCQRMVTSSPLVVAWNSSGATGSKTMACTVTVNP